MLGLVSAKQPFWPRTRTKSIVVVTCRREKDFGVEDIPLES